MRVLFLDDMEDRHLRFENDFFEKFDEIIHVWSYDQCIKALQEEEFGLVFLDHDLSETAIMCDPDNIDERTGTDVAQWIIQSMESDENAPGFIIHSLNPIGRRRMFNMLKAAGFDVKEYPFYWLVPPDHMR